MAIGDSAGILFRIKSDYDAKGIKQAKGDLNELGGIAGKAGSGFTSLAVPAAIAGAAIAAVAVVAVRAAVALFDLTKSAAEYGSAIFDAQQKTGLSAKTLSALKFAADQSGSSLEKISNSVAKFNVLISEANQGNVKANKALELYGITARTTDEALVQAITTIAQMTTADQQAAAAKVLFKDRTAEILPVIKSFSGDLPGLIAKLEELGLIMSNEDTRAADEFGDTLDTLGAQAAALGRQFATELMPMMTGAMSEISRFMAENKDVAREWGQALADAARGSQLSMASAGEVITSHLNAVTGGFNANAVNSDTWATRLINNMNRVAIAFATLGISEIMRATSGAGAAERIKQDRMGGIFGGSLRGGLNIPDNMPLTTGGGGGGGGGGKGGGGGGAAAKDTEFEDSKKRELRILEEVKAGLARQKAELDLHLERKLISELEYTEAVQDLRVKELQAEKQIYETILTFSKISADEREAIEHKLGILRTEIATQTVEDTTEVTKLINKQREAVEKLEEAERKRAEALIRNSLMARARADADRAGAEQEQQKLNNSLNLSILGDSVLSIRDQFGELENMIKPTLPMLQLAGQAINQLAQGIGNLVQEWVLMGSVGPNAMKKMVASVLAGVSAQAAVLAVMELAYGIAALTPWGLAIYGNPVAHFKAAALFGAVAVGAGLAGRAVAGDSFSQASGGGGSGGASGNSSGADRSNASEPFRGFQQQQMMVLASLDETLNRFENRLKGLSPGEVLAMGAEDNPGAIRSAYESELGNDMRATSNFMRKAGNL